MVKKSKLKQLIVALVGISFIVYGIMRSELPIVFNKAVNICLECIGLG